MILLPTNVKLLKNLGENLRLARKRRQFTLEQVAERAGIARSTLWLIEKGNPGVAIGAYLQVLFVLGLEKDINLIAAEDVLGRKLQDANFLRKRSGSGMNKGIKKSNLKGEGPIKGSA